MRHALLLLPLTLALCACAPASGRPTATSVDAAAATPDAATLAGYHWQLAQATDATDARIDALFVRADKPLQLDFAGDRLRVVNACNAMGGSYHVAQGKLEVGAMMHTMMACPNPALNRLDSLIGERLAAHPAITLTQQGDRRLLQLRTAAGETLTFTGVPTAQTRYSSAGTTEFLEIAAQTVPCNHPLMPDAMCLDVREVHYNANGLKTGAPGAWHPLAQIEGYTHQPGTRNVVRVQRYTIKHPPADAPDTAYVLDMVVESDATQR